MTNQSDMLWLCSPQMDNLLLSMFWHLNGLRGQTCIEQFFFLHCLYLKSRTSRNIPRKVIKTAQELFLTVLKWFHHTWYCLDLDFNNHYEQKGIFIWTPQNIQLSDSLCTLSARLLLSIFTFLNFEVPPSYKAFINVTQLWKQKGYCIYTGELGKGKDRVGCSPFRYTIVQN